MGKRLCALFVSGALVFTMSAPSAQATTTTTATTATTAAADACVDLASTPVSELPETARGEAGSLREPNLTEPYEELPAEAVGRGKNWNKPVVVPVAFHIVHDNGLGNVTDADVAKQIEILNLGFAGFYGGVDTGFRFRLSVITRTDNADWYFADPGTSGERAMKRALRTGGTGTLNYYSTTAGAFLGWAYFPGLSPGREYVDGVVVDWESMYKTSETYKDRYDLGFTAVHEVGHWLGLHHTFNGACNAKGDHVDDTPAQGIPTSGCPADATQDTCPREPGFDPIHNFMDYSFDRCYTELTPGQTARARDYWLEFRA